MEEESPLVTSAEVAIFLVSLDKTCGRLSDKLIRREVVESFGVHES